MVTHLSFFKIIQLKGWDLSVEFMKIILSTGVKPENLKFFGQGLWVSLAAWNIMHTPKKKHQKTRFMTSAIFSPLFRHRTNTTPWVFCYAIQIMPQGFSIWRDNTRIIPLQCRQKLQETEITGQIFLESCIFEKRITGKFKKSAQLKFQT